MTQENTQNIIEFAGKYIAEINGAPVTFDTHAEAASAVAYAQFSGDIEALVTAYGESLEGESSKVVVGRQNVVRQALAVLFEADLIQTV